jgi:hypothetical protein
MVQDLALDDDVLNAYLIEDIHLILVVLVQDEFDESARELKKECL